eukprot:jgi/Chlat1/9157/Chrsp97S09283
MVGVQGVAGTMCPSSCVMQTTTTLPLLLVGRSSWLAGQRRPERRRSHGQQQCWSLHSCLPSTRRTCATIAVDAQEAVAGPRRPQPNRTPRAKGNEQSRTKGNEQSKGDDNAAQELRSPPGHKSGYIALMGKPNAGKSTLLNAIIGQKLAIVTRKPQTTRHRILGILSDDDSQALFMDTPGVMKEKRTKLDEMMMTSCKTALLSADLLVLIVDATAERESALPELPQVESMPKTLLVLNKVDLLAARSLPDLVEWYSQNTQADAVFPISAKQNIGVPDIVSWVKNNLPLGPAFYPKDIVSEHPERFFIAEIIREKVFDLYSEEVPYSTQVNVYNYIARGANQKDYVGVRIIVERETQKRILIGKGGNALKALASAARVDIEEFVGKGVFMDMKVEVQENWRADTKLLTNFGYKTTPKAA